MEVLYKVATVINFVAVIFFLFLQWKTNDLVEEVMNQNLTDIANLIEDVKKLKKVMDLK